MNVTFLIGNGFDLACGLKSSYPDVYEEYIKQPGQSEVVKKFKEDLIENKKKGQWGNWSDFEMGMAEYAKKFNNEQELIECVNDFKKYLVLHLEKQQDIFQTHWKVVKREHNEELLNYTTACIKEFSLGTAKGLFDRINTKGLISGYNVNFVNFNYTNVLETILEKNSKGINMVNIHGSLKENNIMVGVDKEAQMACRFPLSAKGKRMFIKPYFNNEEDPDKVKYVLNNIKSSDYICAFGLSFGSSDFMWKNAIINWLNGSEDRHLFLYDLDSSNIKEKDVVMCRNIEEDAKINLLEQKGFCKLGDKIFSQIHIPIGNKIFDYDRIIDKLLSKNKTA